MLSTKCKIHESNPNSVEMSSGGMPYWMFRNGRVDVFVLFGKRSGPPASRSNADCQSKIFGFWYSLLGAESDSCGKNSRWKGPTSRQVRVHFGKSGYSS